MLPENFVQLHAHEEALRTQSADFIRKSEPLARHCAAIEVAMSTILFFTKLPRDDQRDVTVQLLGIRLFNALGSSVKLALSGYYQTSALQQRDILETAFLLNYFEHDSELIARWRSCNEEERYREFRPNVVRKRLDAKQGFTSGKRTAAYKMLCDLAGHPIRSDLRCSKSRMDFTKLDRFGIPVRSMLSGRNWPSTQYKLLQPSLNSYRGKL